MTEMKPSFEEAMKRLDEIVKGLVQTSVFSFPPRPQNPVKPAEKDVPPQSKEGSSDQPESLPDEAAPEIPVSDEAHDSDEALAEAGPDEGEAPALPNDPVQYLVGKGVPDEAAARIAAIFTGSPNQRVAYNELRKEFGNKGGQYLRMMKEFGKKA